MAQQLLMPKATAVWLVDNTALSFDQIAQFCKLHPLEVKAIADGEAAQGIKGLDPISTGQLSRDEIARGEGNPEPQAEAFRTEGSRSGIQAQGPALHAGFQASGSSERHSLAGAQPSGTQGRPDLASRRHHQVDDRADPRPHPLEFSQPDRRWTRSRLASAARSISTWKWKRLPRAVHFRPPPNWALRFSRPTRPNGSGYDYGQEEEKEIDADAVFAKLKSLKSDRPAMKTRTTGTKGHRCRTRSSDASPYDRSYTFHHEKAPVQPALPGLFRWPNQSVRSPVAMRPQMLGNLFKNDRIIDGCRHLPRHAVSDLLHGTAQDLAGACLRQPFDDHHRLEGRNRADLVAHQIARFPS